MTINVHATYHDGLIHPTHPLNLPEGAKLALTIEADVTTNPTAETLSLPARILSPRLARPEQIADFQMDVRQMDVREISDAGV